MHPPSEHNEVFETGVEPKDREGRYVPGKIMFGENELSSSPRFGAGIEIF